MHRTYTWIRNLLTGATAFVIAAGVVAGVASAPDAAAQPYSGCAVNQARIAIRRWGNASQFPSCNLAMCVRANPEQRVKVYGWTATVPPRWEALAEYRTQYGQHSPSAPACPSYVNNAGWVQ